MKNKKREKLKSEKKIISPFQKKKRKRDWRVIKKLFSYYKGNGGWKEENKMKHSLIPKEKDIIKGITSSPITKNMEVGGKWKKTHSSIWKENVGWNKQVFTHCKGERKSWKENN